MANTKHIQFINMLVGKAKKVMQNSYSPYSKYKVGAVVVGESGKIYRGTNIENASFGLTVCAERNAIFSAISNGEKSIKMLVLASQPTSIRQLNSPCGACLQVMAEFAPLDMPVYIADFMEGKVERLTEKKLRDFLPFAFTPKSFIK